MRDKEDDLQLQKTRENVIVPKVRGRNRFDSRRGSESQITLSILFMLMIVLCEAKIEGLEVLTPYLSINCDGSEGDHIVQSDYTCC